MSTKQWTSIDEIRAANKKIGRFWFSQGTIRFFGTIIYEEIYSGRYFVTSEQPPHGPRDYNVRIVNDEGLVSTAKRGLKTVEIAQSWAEDKAQTES